MGRGRERGQQLVSKASHGDDFLDILANDVAYLEVAEFDLEVRQIFLGSILNLEQSDL